MIARVFGPKIFLGKGPENFARFLTSLRIVVDKMIFQI